VCVTSIHLGRREVLEGLLAVMARGPEEARERVDLGAGCQVTR